MLVAGILDDPHDRPSSTPSARGSLPLTVPPVTLCTGAPFARKIALGTRGFFNRHML
jgi:hypothetical protein